MRIITKSLLCACLSLAATAVPAERVSVAVASNFHPTARALAASFSATTGQQVRLSPGSSGKLFAQIVNGAPFDVLLSADAERPQRLEAAGMAVAGTRFTYALGQLVLWSARDDYRGRDCLEVLRAADFAHLAIANPRTAPYGAAARDWLQRQGLWASLRARLVTGENIGQTFHFTASRNADLGLVAAAQLNGQPAGSCRFDVPQADHLPIVQQAVLLERGQRNPAAVAFLAHLQSAAARALIARHGYRLP